MKRSIDATALRTAGLYDPDDDLAPQRLELLQFLIERGATLYDLILARGDLPLLAFDLSVLPEPKFTIAEISERSGASQDLITASDELLAFPHHSPSSARSTKTTLKWQWCSAQPRDCSAETQLCKSSV